MKTSKAKSGLPIPVKRVLRKLGEDISVARRKRKISVQLMAERAFIGRNTVTRMEKGDPGVSIGIYATVLFVLGMLERLGDLVDPANDRLGLTIAEEQLPTRIKSVGRAHGS
jgi:transcriptional regulator with XRE-family HTH domain